MNDEIEKKCSRCGTILIDKQSKSVGQCLSCFINMMIEDDDNDDDGNNGEPDFYECFGLRLFTN